MFNFKPSDTKSELQETIDSLHVNLDTDTSSEQYSNQIDQLVKLYTLKDQTSKRRISPDTLAVVGGNLLGILIIVNHERANVVASKALSFVMKAAK